MSDEANVSVDNIEFDEDLGILHCKNCECWLNTCMHTHKYIKRLKRLDENVKRQTERLKKWKVEYSGEIPDECIEGFNRDLKLLESLYK